MKVALLFPRLDIPFKKLDGVVPLERGYIPPIRTHWLQFGHQLQKYHEGQLHNFAFIEKPMWQFTLDAVTEAAKHFDILYMPHKQRVDFDAGPNVRYYMQTVMPEYFTIDTNGWGANLSYCPILAQEAVKTQTFESFQKRIASNQSKFDQPNKEVLQETGFIFFPCQIPHDETIKYHSNVSVLEALKATLEFAKSLNKRVIVKGHPVNPGAMVDLEKLCLEYPNCEYHLNVSIHECLSKCESVFLVNSGVGFEAMLHNKPIYSFGRSEYQGVVNMVEPNLVDIMSKYTLELNNHAYRSFYEQFIERAYNSRNIESFIKKNGVLNQR